MFPKKRGPKMKVSADECSTGHRAKVVTLGNKGEDWTGPFLSFLHMADAL